MPRAFIRLRTPPLGVRTFGGLSACPSPHAKTLPRMDGCKPGEGGYLGLLLPERETCREIQNTLEQWLTLVVSEVREVGDRCTRGKHKNNRLPSPSKPGLPETGHFRKGFEASVRARPPAQWEPAFPHTVSAPFLSHLPCVMRSRDPSWLPCRTRLSFSVESLSPSCEPFPPPSCAFHTSTSSAAVSEAPPNESEEPEGTKLNTEGGCIAEAQDPQRRPPVPRFASLPHKTLRRSR